MAASADRLKQAARRVAGGVVRDAVQRLAAEARVPPPLPRDGSSAPASPGPAREVPQAAGNAATGAPAPSPGLSTGPTQSPSAGGRVAAFGAEPAPARGTSRAVAEGPTSGGFESSIDYAAGSQAEALVIACNSYLYLPQTLEFLQKGLGVRAFDLIAVPGGMQWLALPDLLPKHHRVSRWAVEYLLRKHSVRRIIGIAHEGCSAYEDESTLGSLARLATGKTTDEHQREHLVRVGRDLEASFGVQVELYYASVREGQRVVFEPLGHQPT
jgi:hypothetical protein